MQHPTMRPSTLLLSALAAYASAQNDLGSSIQDAVTSALGTNSVDLSDLSTLTDIPPGAIASATAALSSAAATLNPDQRSSLNAALSSAAQLAPSLGSALTSPVTNANGTSVTLTTSTSSPASNLTSTGSSPSPTGDGGQVADSSPSDGSSPSSSTSEDAAARTAVPAAIVGAGIALLGFL